MRRGRSRSSFRARRKRSSAFGRRFISKSTSHLFALVDFQRIQLKPFFARLVISCMLFVFVGQGDYGVGSLWSQSRRGGGQQDRYWYEADSGASRFGGIGCAGRFHRDILRTGDRGRRYVKSSTRNRPHGRTQRPRDPGVGGAGNSCRKLLGLRSSQRSCKRNARGITSTRSNQNTHRNKKQQVPRAPLSLHL